MLEAVPDPVRTVLTDIRKIWTSEQDEVILNRIHPIPGLKT